MSILHRSFWGTATGLFAVILLAFSFVMMGTSVSAQTDDDLESITLSPVNKRYKIDAGSTQTDELTILNDGSTAYDFIVYGRPYSVSNEQYEPDFVQTPSNADAYKWVQFQQTKWRIEPGQTVKIPYTLRVPADATPGGHYGVIFAETQPPQASSTSVIRKKRVGSILYATVNGTFTTGGQTLGTDIPFLQFRSPLKANTTIENTGNSDFEATLNYKVSDVFGNVKYEEQKLYAVLPQTTRKMTLEWRDSPWFGLYKVSLSSKYLDKDETNDSFVLMIPRWMLITTVVVIIGGGVYVALRRRHR